MLFQFLCHLLPSLSLFLYCKCLQYLNTAHFPTDVNFNQPIMRIDISLLSEMVLTKTLAPTEQA